MADFPGYAQVDIPASEFYEIFRKYDKDGKYFSVILSADFFKVSSKM